MDLDNRAAVREAAGDRPPVADWIRTVTPAKIFPCHLGIRCFMGVLGALLILFAAYIFAVTNYSEWIVQDWVPYSIVGIGAVVGVGLILVATRYHPAVVVDVRGIAAYGLFSRQFAPWHLIKDFEIRSVVGDAYRHLVLVTPQREVKVGSEFDIDEVQRLIETVRLTMKHVA
jgi:hypothetical protein